MQFLTSFRHSELHWNISPPTVAEQDKPQRHETESFSLHKQIRSVCVNMSADVLQKSFSSCFCVTTLGENSFENERGVFTLKVKPPSVSGTTARLWLCLLANAAVTIAGRTELHPTALSDQQEAKKRHSDFSFTASQCLYVLQIGTPQSTIIAAPPDVGGQQPPRVLIY